MVSAYLSKTNDAVINYCKKANDTANENKKNYYVLNINKPLQAVAVASKENENFRLIMRTRGIWILSKKHVMK